MLTPAELHEGFSQLEGHHELWDPLLEQPGRRAELQLEQPAEPQPAHRHSQLLQRWVCISIPGIQGQESPSHYLDRLDMEFLSSFCPSLLCQHRSPLKMCCEEAQSAPVTGGWKALALYSRIQGSFWAHRACVPCRFHVQGMFYNHKHLPRILRAYCAN